MLALSRTRNVRGRQTARPLASGMPIVPRLVNQPVGRSSTSSHIKANASSRTYEPVKEKREKVLHQFYNNLNKECCVKLLADDFKMQELGSEKQFTKSDYLNLLYNIVLPAVPDFSWTAATNAETDSQGYCIVAVQASGHHTGGALVMPGLPEVPPSGKHFCLSVETQKVLVDNGQVKEILVMPTKGAGPRALYYALSSHVAPQSPTMPPMP